MCATCGCRRGWDSHGDARNILTSQILTAAQVAGIPAELAIQNLTQAVQQQDPARAFLAQVTRPRVVVDIDGTLAERDLAAVVALNAKFGTAYTYGDVTKPGDGWLDDDDQAEWWNEYRHDPVFLRNLAPYQDAQWAVWSLRQGGYHVTVSSDREADLEDVSREWLGQWGIECDDLRIGDGAKAQLASNASPAEPVVFIDDSPKRVDLLGPGRTLYLLDRPWNQGIADQPGLKRVTTWAQILADLPAVQVQGAMAQKGREDTPGDVASTERLRRYWTEGEGAAKIRWGEPGDFNRCREHLAKYVPPGQLAGLCANLHHRALGVWPGREHGKKAAEPCGCE